MAQAGIEGELGLASGAVTADGGLGGEGGLKQSLGVQAGGAEVGGDGGELAVPKGLFRRDGFGGSGGPNGMQGVAQIDEDAAGQGLEARLGA